MATKQISLKLLVHKEQNKVIYAECDNDFVDVLFSFLTMPIGTVVRLAGKQAKMGSISTLYESVEDLDTKFLQTKACKDMLLHPKSAAEEWRKHLIVDIDDTKPTKYYICSSTCCSESRNFISTVGNARCGCGSLMKEMISKPKLEIVASGEDGVFVKGDMRFMISDDLQVSPVSTVESLTLLNKHGISDITVLEERDVNVGAEEVLHLLKCLLLSKTPLTDVFLRSQDTIDGVDRDFKVMSVAAKDMAQSLTEKESGSETEKESGSESKKMSVKLILSKSCNKLLYAECGKEFADFLFNFLAFPLGSIVKVLGGFSSLICLNNLYNSGEVLSFNNCFISEESKDILLDPKLPPFFSSDMQPLQIQEQVPWQPTVVGCPSCNVFEYHTVGTIPYRCSHGAKIVQLSSINPKYPNAVKEPGGAFIARPRMFMVTDELNVKPLSPISGISLLSKLNVSISDLEEHVATVGEKEALSLLKASLVSRTPLSDVFIVKKPKQFAVGSCKRRAASARDIKTEL